MQTVRFLKLNAVTGDDDDRAEVDAALAARCTSFGLQGTEADRAATAGSVAEKVEGEERQGGRD